MQPENRKLSIKTYLDFAQLLTEYRGSHKENRAFALNHKQLLNSPVKILLEWLWRHAFKIRGELNSKRYMDYLASFNSIVGIISFIVGFFVGLGLLSYNGQAPVNIIYYLLIAMILPMFSMSISLFTMFTHGGVANFFAMLFPLHWIERIVSHLPFQNKLGSFRPPFSFEFSKWLFMERLHLFSMLFSIGLLLSLILMVIATDIAFGWSTTLQISPESFHSFLATIGIFWKDIFPSAIPSIDLVEMSHYFRLGDKLDISMVHNADKLGAWWKFLAMTTVVYAIGLRFLFWLFSKNMLQKQLRREFLSLDGVGKILREFKTPFVSTQAPKAEKHLKIEEKKPEKVISVDEKLYESILGWNFSADEIALANDARGIKALTIWAVGGTNTYAQDMQIVKNMSGIIFLYVKSWEPPTMDFIDLLEMLVENKKVKKIQIYPLGTIGKGYKNSEADVEVWIKKIDSINSDKVWIIDNEE
jgi:hypothetical protein